MLKNPEISQAGTKGIWGYYKWLVLMSFGLNSVTNVFLFTAFTPIWSSVAIYYNTTDYNLNWFPNCYYITQITAAFLFNPLIMKYFGVSQILSCSLTSLGLWMLVFVGFVELCVYWAWGISLFLGPLIDLSKLWFEPHQRTMLTFLGQYFNNFGMLIGYSITAYQFNGIIDQSEFNIKYEILIKDVATVALVALVANFINLKTPDNSQMIDMRESLMNSLTKIFSHSESFLDLFSVSTFIGISWCYTMLFGTQQYILGQAYLDVTQVSIMFQIGQILAGTFCTWKLQLQSSQGRQQAFDKLIKPTIIIGFTAQVIEILFFESMSVTFLMFLNLFVGAGLGGLYSVLLESLMEKHYPVQELIIGSILAAVACAISFVTTMILVIPSFLEYGFQIMSYFMVPSFSYITVFYKTFYKRFELEG